jgi:hypothetical protein
MKDAGNITLNGCCCPPVWKKNPGGPPGKGDADVDELPSHGGGRVDVVVVVGESADEA